MTRIRLESPCSTHQEEFLAAAHRSRRLHRPFVAAPNTVEQFEQYLDRLRTGRHVGFLLRGTEGQLVGVVNANEIVGGNFLSAYLGYYAFAPWAGQGLMKLGLAQAVTVFFRKHRLHRLEANIQPHNAASCALVRSLGFQREGLSPRYLKIAGRWRDHERWALLSEQWKPRAITPQPSSP